MPTVKKIDGPFLAPKAHTPTQKMQTNTTNTTNHCRKSCCAPARDPKTIPLPIRIKNAKLVGATGRYQSHRVPIRSLPGIDPDRTGVYTPVSFGAKREWLNDEEGWQTYYYKVRKPKKPVEWQGQTLKEAEAEATTENEEEYLSHHQ